MAELDTLQYLPDDLLCAGLICSTWILLQVIQCCVVYILKHQVEPLLATKHLNQVHQVLMT